MEMVFEVKPLEGPAFPAPSKLFLGLAAMQVGSVLYCPISLWDKY